MYQMNITQFISINIQLDIPILKEVKSINKYYKYAYIGT